MSGTLERLDVSAAPAGEVLRRVSNFDVPAAGAQVDRAAGVIRGMSVMEAVEALGHGMLVDAKTLEQVARFGNLPSGVKSRYTHPGLSADGLGRFLGRMHQFRVEGSRVLADLHIAESAAKSPEGDLRDYVLTLAEEDPAAAGLSIVAYMQTAWKVADEETGEEMEVRAGRYDRPDGATTEYPFARLEWMELESGEKMNPLRAVDLVDEPAANRSGMFAEGTTNELAALAFEALDTADLEGWSEDEVMREAEWFCSRHGIARSKIEPFLETWRRWRDAEGDRPGFDAGPVAMNTSIEHKEEEKGLEKPTPAPSALDRVRGILHTHGSLVEERDALKRRLSEQQKRIAQLELDVAAREEKLDRLSGENQHLSEQLELMDEMVRKLESDAKAAEARAVHIVAEAGVPTDRLPDPSVGEDAAEESVDELRRKLAETRDVDARAALLERIKSARGWRVTDAG